MADATPLGRLPNRGAPPSQSRSSGYSTLLGLFNPGLQRGLVACPHQCAKHLREGARAVGFRAAFAKEFDVGPLRWIQVGWVFQE
jgi:hypothetical protein